MKTDDVFNQIKEELGIDLSKDSLNKPNSKLKWQARLLYSFAGRMGLMATFDKDEEGKVSVKHIKKRMKVVFLSYFEVFPDLQKIFPEDIDALVEEMYDLYLSEGFLYHQQYYVTYAMPSECSIDNLTFTRGFPIFENHRMSGLGTYLGVKKTETKPFAEMFRLLFDSLNDLWAESVKNRKWYKHLNTEDWEFLNTKLKYNSKEWIQTATHDGRISLARRRAAFGQSDYYLYQYQENQLYVAKLMEWETQDFRYRDLANAKFAAEGKLKPILYLKIGKFVRFKIQYSLPPSVEKVLLLYSWPRKMNTMGQLEFKRDRIMNKKIFEILKSQLSSKGFLFEERVKNA